MAMMKMAINRKVVGYSPHWEHTARSTQQRRRKNSSENLGSWEEEKASSSMSNNRGELIAYIKRLGYSEKIAEEVLRQRGDRISKSELLNYVVIAASKNKDVRTKPSADYLNNQDSFRKPDGSTLRKPLWKRKNNK